MSQFNYKFVYSKGSDNVNSDFLSRLHLPITVADCEPYEIVSTLNTVSCAFISCEDLRKHTDNDPDLVILKQYIRTGFPNNMRHSTLSKFKSFITELTITKGCIMFRNRVFIPQSLRSQVLDILHENHPGIVAMKALARSVIWYPGLD